MENIKKQNCLYIFINTGIERHTNEYLNVA